MKELFLIKIWGLIFAFFSCSICFCQGTDEKGKNIFYDIYINISKCEIFGVKKTSVPYNLDKEKFKTTYDVGINILKNINNFYIGSGIQYQNRGFYQDTLFVYSYIYPSKYKYYKKRTYTYLVIPVILQYNIFQKKTELLMELGLQPKLEYSSKSIRYEFGNNNFSKSKSSHFTFFDFDNPQLDISFSLIYCYTINDNNSIGIKATYTHFLFAFQSSYIHPFKTLGIGLNYSF